jgi:hypothetical protein
VRSIRALKRESNDPCASFWVCDRFCKANKILIAGRGDMDPLTAFAGLGLACNIIQLSELGIKLAKQCKEISATGSTREISATIDLSDIVIKVSDTSTNFPPNASPGSTAIPQVQDCATRSVKAATELKTLAREITHRKDGTERTLLEKGYKSLRMRSKIEAQQKSLAQIQSSLQTSLLNSIRGDIRSSRDITSQQLVAVNTSVQNVIDGNAAATTQLLQAIEDIQRSHKTELVQTAQSINAQTMSTQNAITARLDTVDIHIDAAEAIVAGQLKAINLDDRQRHALERLHDMLSYETMHERENDIRARVHDYGETAKWIFGDLESIDDAEVQNRPVREAEMQGRKQAVYRSFETWVRSGSGIWFVEGKAGSGKSSLMSFVRENLEEGGRAHHLALEWAQGKPCRVLSFFFFRPAASKLAKSFEGLWRSLCAQLLSDEEALIRHVLNDPNAPRSIRAATSKDRTAKPRWRSEDYRSWLMYLLAQTSGRVIIMLDGLDEFQEFEESDEGHGALLDDLRTLRRNYPHVKLVCSARPDEPFKSALRSESSLKLQDVNYADISIFASSTLAGTAASGYAHQIAESADGVFLWAHIVAHDLAKAARRGVSSTVLKERFEHCPKEMHDLFKHMIERQDSFYRSKPQPILYLFELASRTNRHGINLFDLLLLSCSDYASRTLLNLLSGTFPKKFIEDLEARADGFGDEVTERCGGLVAVNHFSFDTGTGHPDWPDDFMRWRDSKHPTLWKLMDYRVQFVHRTAHDFLREDGASFLGRHAMTLNESQGNLLLALASIGFVNLDSYCFEDIAIDLASVTARFQDFINDALQGSHCVEECCQAIDACVQRLAERLPQWSKSDDLQIRQYSCSRVKIPACPALPLEFRIALTLVGNLSQERGKIWSVYIVPRISRLSNDIRQIAAALAAMCIAVHGSGDTHERAFEILEIASPFTKLPLLMRNDAADDSGMSWRSRHSMRAEPLWQHFFSYGIFPLLSHPVLRERTRMMARSFFDQGVSEHAT